MPEETPQLPVSEQEVQIEAPSLLDKIKTQKKKILIGLGSFLGVLIFAGAVFGVYKYAQRQLPLEPVEGPTPEVATLTPDSTANWKIYKNEALGFQFKYPSDPKWNIKEEATGIGYLAICNYDKAPEIGKIPINSDLFKIEIFIDREHSDVNQWFKEELGSFTIDKKPYEFLSVKAIEVNFQKGIVFKLNILKPCINAVFESPRTKLIHFNSGGDCESNRHYFDLILSTFQFLEEADPGQGRGRESCGEMTLAEAKEIALESECVKEGNLKETYLCNDSTGTWWLDLDIEKPGCAPACVVNVVTKEAEINWRCTGLIPD